MIDFKKENKKTFSLTLKPSKHKEMQKKAKEHGVSLSLFLEGIFNVYNDIIKK